MFPGCCLLPAKTAALEARTLHRIGYVLRLPSESCELTPPAFADRAGHLRLFMIGKVKEWCRCGPLLALKEHRHKWPQQHQSRGGTGTVHSGDRRNPITLGTISYLVVVLDIAQKT